MPCREQETLVCGECIGDEDLRKLISENADALTCHYCRRRRKTPFACGLSVVLERIRFAVDQNFRDPGDFVSWDKGEGGWLGHPVVNAWDLFAKIGFETENAQLMEKIIDAFADSEYADEDYWPNPLHERHMASWERFKEIIKYERRYTFWGLHDDPELGRAETQPSNMLNAIVKVIQELDLLRTLPIGHTFARVRVHSADEELSKASDLTPPPRESAVFANRMSPVGIPMFYGADDFDTASLETIDPQRMEGKVLTGGMFRTLLPLKVLDLTNIPRLGGYFSGECKSYKEAVKFLTAFTTDLSRPVRKNGCEHTEYVPTQVFTEFIRFELPLQVSEPIHGIKYPSSKNRKGCYVIFVGQKECLPSEPPEDNCQILEFDESSRRTSFLP